MTIDAEDLFLRHYLGILEPRQAAATATWIRSRQRPDGSWATYFGGPGDLSTSVEAYVALRLAGDPPDAAHMRSAAAFVREAGGVAGSRVFTRMWLSLLALWSWDEVPTLPPEQILLPVRAPLSIYSFGCWARQTIVALSIVTALRPSRAVPFTLDELRGAALAACAGDRRLGPGLPPARPCVPCLQPPPGRGRAAAGASHRRALGGRRVRNATAPGEGSSRRGSGRSSPSMRSATSATTPSSSAHSRASTPSRSTTRRAGGSRPASRRSGIRHSSVIALLDAGIPASDPAVVRACEWLVAQEGSTRGDWAVRRPELTTGGFPFEFANENYPDVDDTAVVVLALRRAGHDPTGAAGRGLQWMLGMQSRSGGFGAFDVDNESSLCARLAFCDFGAVTDPPSSDVTAHVLETLAHEGRAGEQAAVRALGWLLAQQERDGSWFGRWGANYLYGTGSALPALAACGLGGHESARAAVRWLERVQNPGGGFGEDLRSYRDRSWSGRGTSTASQTAWALLGLHAAGEGGGVTAQGAVQWLVETQRADGGWDEQHFTGTGFPGDFYLNYHLYRDVFPVMALGRVLGPRG